ncbi:MAG: acyl carrier protein, partial [Acidobacteriota bacterium]
MRRTGRAQRGIEPAGQRSRAHLSTLDHLRARPAAVATEGAAALPVASPAAAIALPVAPPAAAGPAAAGPPSVDATRDALVGLLAKVTGLAPSEIDPHRKLAEMGLDSLLIVRLRQAIQRNYGVEIELRRFFDDLGTLEQLAAHVAPHAPAPSAVAPAPSAVASAPSAVAPAPSAVAMPMHVPSAAAGGDAATALMAQQIQAMQDLFARQLAALQ